MNVFCVNVFEKGKFLHRVIFYDEVSACMYVSMCILDEGLEAELEVGNEEETDNGCIKISFRD